MPKSADLAPVIKQVFKKKITQCPSHHHLHFSPLTKKGGREGQRNGGREGGTEEGRKGGREGGRKVENFFVYDHWGDQSFSSVFSYTKSFFAWRHLQKDNFGLGTVCYSATFVEYNSKGNENPLKAETLFFSSIYKTPSSPYSYSLTHTHTFDRLAYIF